MGTRRGALEDDEADSGALEHDEADSGGVSVDALTGKLKISEVDNVSSNPSVLSSWLLGSSTEKLHNTLITQYSLTYKYRT